jgi:hypothetical protein
MGADAGFRRFWDTARGYPFESLETMWSRRSGWERDDALIGCRQLLLGLLSAFPRILISIVARGLLAGWLSPTSFIVAC